MTNTERSLDTFGNPGEGSEAPILIVDDDAEALVPQPRRPRVLLREVGPLVEDVVAA